MLPSKPQAMKSGYTFNMTTAVATSSYAEVIGRLIPNLADYEGSDLAVHSPIDGALLANLKLESLGESKTKVAKAQEAFRVWRDIPGPRRGEFVRIFGQKLRDHKE